MKKIYELHMDTFKQSYREYWSSIDLAMEKLPLCKRFHESLGWRLPQRPEGSDFDWEYNKTLKPKLTLEGDRIKVTIPGFRWKKCEYKKTPEIKEPGKPYQAPDMVRVKEWTEEVDQDMGFIEIYETALDTITPF